jgi:small conductance mechanosensitive channel
VNNIDMDKITAVISLYGMKVLGAIAILLIGRWLVGAGARFAKSLMLKSRVDDTLAAFAGNALYFLGLAFVVIAALGQLGIQTTSLAAVHGAAGLAVALSLQGSLGNLASGVLIIGTHPFRIGDMVEVAGQSGKVTAVNIFATELLSADNKRIIIPNGKITSEIIVNHWV